MKELQPFCNRFVTVFDGLALVFLGIMKQTRIFVYPKDVQLITGRSEAYARRVISTIKKSLGKQKHQLVTYAEFCEFIGANPEDMEGYFR